MWFKKKEQEIETNQESYKFEDIYIKSDDLLNKFNRICHYQFYTYLNYTPISNTYLDKAYHNYAELSKMITNYSYIDYNDDSQYIRCNLYEPDNEIVYKIYAEGDDTSEYEHNETLISHKELDDGTLVLKLKTIKKNNKEKIDYEYTKQYKAGNWRFETHHTKKRYYLSESEKEIYFDIIAVLSNNGFGWIKNKNYLIKGEKNESKLG